MNTKLTLMSVSLFLASLALPGCSTNVSNPPNVPASAPVINIQATSAPKDNFDKTGEGVATVSRWTWNAAIGAYEWTKGKAVQVNDEYNTEENRQGVVDAVSDTYVGANKKAGDLYDAATKK